MDESVMNEWVIIWISSLSAEDLVFDVVGCLEYDPNQPCPKKHREYLKRIANFRQVISIGNAELVSKIHQTYRVQYIHDAVLPAPNAFEENMLSTLSSFIFFNKVEIVTLIQVSAGSEQLCLHHTWLIGGCLSIGRREGIKRPIFGSDWWYNSSR